MAPTHTSSLDTFFGSAPTNAFVLTHALVPTAAVPAAVASTPLHSVSQRQAMKRQAMSGGRHVTSVSSRQVAFVGVVLALLLALVGVFGLVGDKAGADDGTFSYVEPTLYIVQPGDSLWSIAEELHPNADPRPLVAELKSVAGTANLQIGQRLLIPSYVAG